LRAGPGNRNTRSLLTFIMGLSPIPRLALFRGSDFNKEEFRETKEYEIVDVLICVKDKDLVIFLEGSKQVWGFL
jgi:hypothetical protein